MKILLSALSDVKDRTSYIYPIRIAEPIGLLYVASFLQRLRHQVKTIVPFSFEEFSEFTPDVVGFSVMTFQHNEVLEIAKQIKQKSPQTKIVVGGPHPSGYPEIVLNPSIDVAVLGEGEITIGDYIFRLGISREVELEDIPGIAFERDGSVVRTRPQLRIQDLDSMPWAMRIKEVLNQTKMSPMDYDVDGRIAPSNAQISSSRGCASDCSFCLSPTMWRQEIRFRSPREVVNEMFSIKAEFGITFFALNDLTFNGSIPHVHRFCDEMIERDVNVHWECLCSPTLSDTSIYQKMRQAGCIRIGWGVESASNIRRLLGKKYGSLNTMKDVLTASDEAGILNRGFLVIGHPEEKEEDIQNTQDMLKELPLDNLSGRFLTLFPGTAFWDKYRDRLLTDDFSRFTTQVPVIEPIHMTVSQVSFAQERIARDFYESDAYRRHRDCKMKRFPHLRPSFEAEWQDMIERGVIK